MLSFLLIFPFVLLAQNNPESFIVCGTTIGSEEHTLDRFFGNNQELVDILIANNVNIDENYLQQLDNMDTLPNMNPEMLNPTSTQYEIPIKAWIYRNDNGTGNISTSQVYQVIDELNTIYSANTNISFYLLCDISEVNNSNYANYGDQYFTTYSANNRTPGAINVHFVISSAPPPYEVWNGIGYLPWQTTPYTSAVSTYNNTTNSTIAIVGNSLAHEIGHNLGLLHTHANIRQDITGYNESAGNCFQEAVSRGKRQGLFCVSTINRLKCEINGDGLCDTEADPGIKRNNRDPFSYLFYESCDYNPAAGGQDNWGDTWTPTVSNIMSYGNYDCRTSFSPLQVGKMYGYIGGIGINNPTFNISGPDALCYNQTATYSVNTLPGVTSYFWEVPNNMTILPSITSDIGQGTPTVRIKANSGAGGEIKVTPNCGSPLAVADILNLNNIDIEGFDQACPLYTYTYTAPFISGGDYFWTITNGTIQSGQYSRNVQIKMTQNSNQSTLQLKVTNVCSDPINAYKTIIHGNPPPPAQQCISYKETVASQFEPMQKIPITEFAEMLLFPNPASTEVTIIAPTKGHFILSIFNTLGQSMYGESIEIQNKQTINVNAFPDGVYYVKLEGKTGTSTKKLILKK